MALSPGQMAEIDVRFQYHRPSEEQQARMQHIRELCRELAIEVTDKTPICREQSLAITAIEEVSMWANAAIARREEEA